MRSATGPDERHPLRWRAARCRSRERCGTLRRKPCGAGLTITKNASAARDTALGMGATRGATTPTRLYSGDSLEPRFSGLRSPVFGANAPQRSPGLNVARAAAQAANGSFTLRRRRRAGPRPGEARECESGIADGYGRGRWQLSTRWSTRLTSAHRVPKCASA